jgi:NAD(P)-dependent dehydrogenase (short-subunit alcohol dehydrogenase family)
MAMEVSLEGKVALVTGAGPNIGSGIALALGKYGARVACNDVNADAAEACVRRIERNGCEAMSIPGDVTDEEDVKGYIEKVLSTWGRIDILVNNASLLGGRTILDETLEDWTRAVNVSGIGNFLNTKYVARSMCERGVKGSIVCIASSSGWQGTPGAIAYAFHKGGVINFARAAAVELAPYGIRVNTFTPTMVNPDNPELLAARQAAGPRQRGIGAGQDEEPWRRPTRAEMRPNMVPMGTTGTPTDIGHCIAWMCSDFARLITGADFVVDGGARAKNWSHVPAEPDELAGPLPLAKLDLTDELG